MESSKYSICRRYVDSPLEGSFTIPEGVRVRHGQHVIIETNRGIECARLVALIFERKAIQSEVIVTKFIRKATRDDLAELKSIESHEQGYLSAANRLAIDEGWPVRIVLCEILFDRSRCIMFYHKEEPTKKKSHQRNLSIQDYFQRIRQESQYRMEFRETGPRACAKIMSGCGICGCQLCCAGFLHHTPHVSVKSAKVQGLASNLPKMIGSCGRLKCCLAYEQDNYEQGVMNMEKVSGE